MRWGVSFILLVLLGCDQGQSEYRNIGVTKVHIIHACGKNILGRCEVPVSEVAFYFRAPAKFVGTPADEDYHHFVGIPLHVTKDDIFTVFERPQNAGENYIVGTPVETIRIAYIERGLEAQISRLSTYTHGIYGVVASDMPGYIKYDDLLCGQAISSSSTKDERLFSSRCGSRRRVIYVPDNDPDTTVTCWQVIPDRKAENLAVCQVRTLLTEVAEARYGIRSRNFFDGSWLEQNKRIVSFLSAFVFNTK